MLGDWCLDSLADRVPAENWSWRTGVDKQKGAAAHEMGHTIGLPHPDILNPVTHEQDYPYTLMGAWWSWPDFPENPADPTWPLNGLHGWGRNSGPNAIDAYNDSFLLDYRVDWFQDALDYPADLDGDGDVDLLDFGRFQLCFTGTDGGPLEPECQCADFDNDIDVDWQDFVVFQLALDDPQ